jgi:hypothetical protein
MERQESRLSGERPAELRAVLDEGVLHRVIGSPGVMRQQFERLAQVGEQPNVTIQLLPFALGAHPGLYGPFVILTFPQPTAPLVWLENPNNSVYLESQSDVQNYTDTFDQLRASALSPAETLTRLIRTAEELEP